MTTPEEQIQQLLTSFRSNTPGVQTVSLVSLEGRTVGSTIAEIAGKMQLAALSAASIAIGKKAANDLHLGGLDQIVLAGVAGSLLLVAVGAKSLLSVITAAEADTGAIGREAKRVATKILGVI